MRLKKKQIAALLASGMMLFTLSANASATENGTDPSAADSRQIIYKEGIHYIENSGQSQEWIMLFCMNNKLRYPHNTPDIGDVHIPEYTEGYLTEDDFASPAKHEEFLRRASNLLFAGYPCNGAGLYELVPNEKINTPTAEDFNKMLIPPAQLADDFPRLKHYEFTYPATEEQIAVLSDFVRTVTKMPADGATLNGLSKDAIQSMPFYKASVCLTWNAAGTPMELFANAFGASYFVTEQQAYDATQLAFWKLLYDYGVADNDIDSLNDNELATNFIAFSEQGKILTHQPELSELKLEGDMTFQYHPKDGLWHSKPLQLVEPAGYNGIYKLILPEGVTTLHHMTHIYGNEEYELVSDHPVGEGETFGIEENFTWLRGLRQYSPSPDVEVNGKKFQHMAGAVLEHTTLNARLQYQLHEEGSVSVSMSVVGGDSEQSFVFQLYLPDNEINGTYGDMDFTDGFAQFELKHGETKTATHLPSGAKYYLTEVADGAFYIESKNDAGVISQNQEIAASFTNTPLPDLTLSKMVTGENGEQSRLFTFTIELRDPAGKPINGLYEYFGSVKAGYENEVKKPEDGELYFVNGKAQIQLSHGQQITLKSLPYKGIYSVTETEANQNGYVTFYNKHTDQAAGNLLESAVVQVENHKASIQNQPAKPAAGKPATQPIDKTSTSPAEERPATPAEEASPTPAEEASPTPAEEAPSTPTEEAPSKPADIVLSEAPKTGDNGPIQRRISTFIEIVWSFAIVSITKITLRPKLPKICTVAALIPCLYIVWMIRRIRKS